MPIDRRQVERVAQLARLSLSDGELDRMTLELGQIVSLVDQMSELDTEGVEPLLHPLEVRNAMREDVVEPSLSRDQALQNAPSHDETCFRVPAVFGS